MTAFKKVWWLFAALFALATVAHGQNGAAAADFKALVFSKTLLFRHASITNGIAAIRQLGAANHFQVDATEDASWFTAIFAYPGRKIDCASTQAFWGSSSQFQVLISGIIW